MSVPNLVILALFCVKLSSGQGLVYQRSSSRSPCDLDLKWIYHPDKVWYYDRPTDRPTDLPTDMSKAIYPHFVERGHDNVENSIKHHSFNKSLSCRFQHYFSHISSMYHIIHIFPGFLEYEARVLMCLAQRHSNKNSVDLVTFEQETAKSLVLHFTTENILVVNPLKT